MVAKNFCDLEIQWTVVAADSDSETSLKASVTVFAGMFFCFYFVV